MKRLLFIHLAIIFLLMGCKEDHTFDKSPALRTQEQLIHFQSKLKSAPYGWEMIYFPKIDSLLFINATATLKNTAVNKEYYGYGGYKYLIRFSDDNKLKMMADTDNKQEIMEENGEYAVKLNNSIQLSFTTYTSIHKLINHELGGVADFLFQYEDFKGNLIFTTANENNSSKPYIMLSPLKSEEEWNVNIKKAQENRLFFERMKNPQIRLRKGGKVFYESDVFLSDAPSNEEGLRKRYHLFLFLIQEYGGVIQKGYNAIGSGYAGTAKGLTFRPGFFYSNKVVFRDFSREGDKFIAELVNVYNPITRKFQYESKHLFPEGETTNYIAEIYDAK